MRLTDQEKEAIVNSIKSIDKDAEVYLFGSRVNDSERGGDIDILILSTNLLGWIESLRLCLAWKICSARDLTIKTMLV